jgi:diguanylate cyclase (GGDEF)-like protein
VIDNSTLLLSIAFSSGALTLTFFVAWLTDRRETYLFSYALGLAFIVSGLSTLAIRDGIPGQLIRYSALLTGLAIIYHGTYQFRRGTAPLAHLLPLIATSIATTCAPVVLGYLGLGLISLNLWCTAFTFMAASQYWSAREEAPFPLTISSGLFVLTSLSFLTCAWVLVAEGNAVLAVQPDNWAEEFNSIMIIVGLTGIGAISLTLNHSRATRRHRIEAQTDDLTGLLNRRALFEKFQSAPLPNNTAVMMFDIDHFKQINDEYGHAAGDAVIQHFGATLRASMRGLDTTARLGGEEFCAVLPDMSLDLARAIGDRVRAELEARPIIFSDKTIPATVSVGVACSGEAEDFSTTLSRADSGLYKAKRGGRNRVNAVQLKLIA